MSPLTESTDATLLTDSQRCESVNTRQGLPSANRPTLSPQQQRILALAARPCGVSSHECVIAIGAGRIKTRDRYTGRYFKPPSIVGTPAARAIAASVSRSLSRLLRLGLLEYCARSSYTDAKQLIHGHEYRYHARGSQ